MLLKEILRELKCYQDQSLTTQVVHEQGTTVVDLSKVPLKWLTDKPV